MDITLSHRSALEMLRAARTAKGAEGIALVETDLVNPGLDVGQRCTSSLITELKRALGLPQKDPVDVMVGEASRRIRNRDVTCRVWNTQSKALKRGLHFMELQNGTVIPCPEILLLQMADTLPLPQVIALGDELCGKYTLAPSRSSASATTGIPAVTSRERISDVLNGCKGLRGCVVLREALCYIQDGSLSPMETCLATLAPLPLDQFGYQLGEVLLNSSVRPSEDLGNVVLAESRVPDLLFSGTTVGLNYDGDVHLDLAEVVSAARALEASPREMKLSLALDEALDKARRSAASDKQRDRDLLTMGYTVLPVTKYDVRSITDFDRLMGQAMVLIERTTGRDLSLQRQALSNTRLQQGRQKLLRTLVRE